MAYEAIKGMLEAIVMSDKVHKSEKHQKDIDMEKSELILSGDKKKKHDTAIDKREALLTGFYNSTAPLARTALELLTKLEVKAASPNEAAVLLERLDKISKNLAGFFIQSTAETLAAKKTGHDVWFFNAPTSQELFNRFKAEFGSLNKSYKPEREKLKGTQPVDEAVLVRNMILNLIKKEPYMEQASLESTRESLSKVIRGENPALGALQAIATLRTDIEKARTESPETSKSVPATTTFGSSLEEATKQRETFMKALEGKMTDMVKNEELSISTLKTAAKGDKGANEVVASIEKAATTAATTHRK